MTEEELLGEEEGGEEEEGQIGDSDGEEVPEDGQEEEMEEMCMDEEGEVMDAMEDEDQFPDSNFEDGNEFSEVGKKKNSSHLSLAKNSLLVFVLDG